MEVDDDGTNTDECFPSIPKKFFGFFGWCDDKVKELNDDGVTMSVRFTDGEESSWTMNEYDEHAKAAAIKVASKG